VPGGVEILERQRADGVNAILQSIRTERLAPGARAEVLNRLPVHVGDPINDDAVKRIGEVLATIDEHLILRMDVDQAGNVSLMIVPQNEHGSGQHEFGGDRYWFPGPASGTVENSQKPAAPR
jgi:hypothetical protein